MLPAGSSREIRSRWASLTHTASGDAAIPAGVPPTEIPLTPAPCGSIRETVPSRLLATHTAFAPAAIARGSLPTPIGGRSVPDRGSIRVTVLLALLTTQM